MLLTLYMISKNKCRRLLPWLLDPHLHQRPANCQEFQCPTQPIDLLSITDFIELHKELDPFKVLPTKAQNLLIEEELPIPCLLNSSEHLEAPSIPQPAPNLHYLHHHCPVFEVLGC